MSGSDGWGERGRCCPDPLCPCDHKPGSGPYADSGRRTPPHPDPDYDEEPRR